MQVLAALVSRVDPYSLAFEPETGPPFGEFNTSRQYGEMCRRCRKDHPFRDPVHGVFCWPIGIMMMMDKMAVGRLHTTSCFPCYLAVMNQNADDRYCNSSVNLVAYFPHFTSNKVKTRSTAKKLAHHRTIHHCCAIMYEPLRHFQQHGIFLRLRNGDIIWVKPYISYINTDNPEQNFQCTLRQGGMTFYPLRDVLMRRDLLGELVRLAHQNGARRAEFKKRTVKSHREAVEKAFTTIKSRRSRNDGTMRKVEELLDSLSILPVQNAYWDVPMAPGNVYHASYAEILHMVPQGWFARIRKSLFALISLAWKGWNRPDGGISWAIDTIENRMRSLPQFTDGVVRICHFPKGVWALNWISAEDHISMFQQLVSYCVIVNGIYAL